MRDPLLTRRAKTMRREMTEAETLLWLELRAVRFAGVKFRRQKVVGDYIVDFAANNPKLIVKLDGDTHGTSQSYDARRTRFLETKGYRVVRFANNDVMENMEGVLLRLDEVIAVQEGRPPLPTLSPEGERA